MISIQLYFFTSLPLEVSESYANLCDTHFAVLSYSSNSAQGWNWNGFISNLSNRLCNLTITIMQH